MHPFRGQEVARPLRGRIAVGLLVIVLAATGVTVGLSGGAGAASLPPLGVYGGAAATGGPGRFVAGTGTSVALAEDFLPGNAGWSGMTSASSLSWLLGPWKAGGDQLVLGVPIIPTDSSGNAVGTLAGGAAGQYDSSYTTLAQSLVAGGEGNAILRPGWEFNGNWFKWSVATAADAANYAGYFRHIVSAMRAVPGQSFKFVWNPTGGSNGYDLSLAYPGNASVDYIGTDVYDQTWSAPQTPEVSWTGLTTGPNGMNWSASFAAAQGKPLAVPEWGLSIRSDGHGLGDDPFFVTQMAAWLAGHDVGFSVYFDVDVSDGSHDILDGRFPNALAAFRTAFAAGTAPTTTTTAGPTTTVAPAPTTTTTVVRPPTTTTTVPPAPAPTTTTTSPPVTNPPVTNPPVTTRPVTTPPTTTTTTTVVTGPPSAPSQLRAVVSGSSVIVTWVNPAGVQGDNVFRDGVKIGWPGWPNPVVTSFTDRSVSAGTHRYTVAGYNSSGQGPVSVTVVVTVARHR